MDHLVLIGGGGVVGRDLTHAFAESGMPVDIVERDYYTVAGAKRFREGASALEVLLEVSRTGSVWVNLGGLGDAFACERDPSAAVSMNVVLAIDIARIASKIRIPLIHISTWEVYGLSGQALEETITCSPKGVYALSKYVGESSASQVASMMGGRFAAMRIGPVIGPNMRDATVLRSFAVRASSGQALEVVGRGAQGRQFLDYRDLGRAVLSLARSDCWTHSVYNVASDTMTTIHDLAMLISARFNGIGIRYVEATRIEPPTAYLPTARMFDEFLWKPEFSMHETLEHVIPAMNLT